MIDITLFNSYVDRKLVSRREHPEGGLYIWNYTPVAQFSRTWDDVTMQARGLITDLQGNVISRPFRKFFNYSEHDNPELSPIPVGQDYQVFDKMDGSLGIMYPIAGSFRIATRGSFESEQAIWATQLLQRRYGAFVPEAGLTYLFEIIYPQNRIVVDYEGQEDLILLDVLDTATGKSVPIGDVPFNTVERFEGLTLDKLAKTERPNKEGYVVKFANELRIKVKHEDYVRLHRLLTQVSSKSIWELLKNGQDFDELIENVPDEFFSWVKQTADDLKMKHSGLIVTAHQSYEKVKDLPTRKEMAQALTSVDPVTRAMTFALLDGKEAQAGDIAWKSLKPSYEKPFKEDIDA